MNSSSLRYVLLKLCFPAAFLVAIILLVVDATAPPVVAQVRTVTVTETVRVLVTVTGFVTVTQQVYITWERTVMVTVATGIPTTIVSVMTSVVTSAVTSILTQTSLVSSLVTQTLSVAAPIRIGPLSLDLADAGGLRFLGYSGGVVLAGLIGGGLIARARIPSIHSLKNKPVYCPTCMKPVYCRGCGLLVSNCYSPRAPIPPPSNKIINEP